MNKTGGGQIPITIALVLIALFSIAIISYAVNFAADNSAAVDIRNDPELVNLDTNMKGNMSAFNDNSESQYQSIVETTIEPGSDSAQSVGPFAVTPENALGTTKNIIKVGYVKIFGTGTGYGIFLGSLISLIIFVIGLYLYKTLRGLPD
jgi:hypothetical protein